jgi:hypothetical protein
MNQTPILSRTLAYIRLLKSTKSETQVLQGIEESFKHTHNVSERKKNIASMKQILKKDQE